MSETSNLELLKARMGKAYSDPGAFFEIVHPDVEWDIRDSSSPMAGVYHGRDAVREFYRQWAGAFSNWSFESFGDRSAALAAAGLGDGA